jgi:hypothetical protein
VTFTVALPQLAHAGHVTPPPMPANIRVPTGHQAFLEGHAVGTQNYICLPSGWTFFGLQATGVSANLLHRCGRVITLQRRLRGDMLVLSTYAAAGAPATGEEAEAIARVSGRRGRVRHPPVCA